MRSPYPGVVILGDDDDRPKQLKTQTCTLTLYTGIDFGGLGCAAQDRF